MSRKAVDVDVRYSLWGAIPDVYAGRAGAAPGVPTFFENFVEAFDAVLAPAHVTIEDLDLYLDPRTCPPDFLPWLAGWLGVALNERWPLARRRHFVHRAAQIFRIRGTIDGVTEAVELYTGVRPTVIDSGGTSWSQTPNEALNVSSPQVTVRVPPTTEDDLDMELVTEIANMAKPAHVTLIVEQG